MLVARRSDSSCVLGSGARRPFGAGLPADFAFLALPLFLLRFLEDIPSTATCFRFELSLLLPRPADEGAAVARRWHGTASTETVATVTAAMVTGTASTTTASTGTAATGTAAMVS